MVLRRVVLPVVGVSLYSRDSELDMRRSADTHVASVCPPCVAALAVAMRAAFDVHRTADDSVAGDAGEIVALAIRNRVPAFVIEALKAGRSPVEAERIDAALGAYRRQAALRNLASLAAVPDVVAAAAEADCELVFMKGAPQQLQLYGDVAVKPAGDLDALIPRASYGRMRSALESRGFETLLGCRSIWWRYFLGEQHLRRKGRERATIDMHFRVSQPGVVAPRDPQAFINGAETVLHRDQPLRTLARVDAALLATISIAKALFHREPFGGHLCDLFAALDCCSSKAVEQFLAYAARQGLLGTALVALRILLAVFPVLLDARVEGAAKAALPGPLGEETLAAAALAPGEAQGTAFPRVHLLWFQCGRVVPRFGREVLWMAASESCRFVIEPAPASTKILFNHKGNPIPEKKV